MIISGRVAKQIQESIERNPEELMQEAASDTLFLADLNETMNDFDLADQEENIDDILTVERLAR